MHRKNTGTRCISLTSNLRTIVAIRGNGSGSSRHGLAGAGIDGLFLVNSPNFVPFYDRAFDAAEWQTNRRVPVLWTLLDQIVDRITQLCVGAGVCIRKMICEQSIEHNRR